MMVIFQKLSVDLEQHFLGKRLAGLSLIQNLLKTTINSGLAHSLRKLKKFFFTTGIKTR